MKNLPTGVREKRLPIDPCRELTMSHFGLGVGANYLDSTDQGQPLLLLSSRRLGLYGFVKHAEVETQRFRKTAQACSTGEK